MIQHMKGKIPRQAHVAVPEGLFEDELGRQGFSGRVAYFYRRNPPIEYTRIEGKLRPRVMHGYKLQPTDLNDPNGSPVKLFYNDDLSYFISRRSAPMPFYFRNADGDEVQFIHKGHGTLETEFGPLAYEEGDYIVIPKGTTYRVVPQTSDNFTVIIEARGEVTVPDRGLVGQYTPFDTSVFVYPEPQPQEGDGRAEYEVRIKREDDLTSVFYPFCPLDVEGWKGTLCVFKFNARDFRSLTSDRIHLPPSAHVIFQASGFLLGMFAPRPLENDPQASRVPWYHRNIDYDEVYFVHASTRGFDAKEAPSGLLQVLPQGIHHGLPRAVHEAAKKNWQYGEALDVYVVGIDAEKPVRLTPEAEAIELHIRAA